MKDRPIIRVDDDRDHTSLYDRCMGIIERGIKKMGAAGSLPVSGHGKPRKIKGNGKKKR